MSQSLVRKALQQTLQTEEPRKPRTKKRTKKNAPLEDMEFLIDLAAADDIDPASSSCVRKKKRSRASVSETATAHPVENVYWEKKKIKKNEERIVKKLSQFMGHAAPSLPLKDSKTLLAEKRKRRWEREKRRKERERRCNVRNIALTTNILS